MDAFKGLYIKELKLTIILFLTGIGLIYLLTMISLTLKEYLHEPMIPAILFFMALMAHTFYLPIILFSSLQREGQGQLWLHNPNSGMKLLLSKLVAGFTYSAISLVVTALLTYFALNGIVDSSRYDEFASIQEYLLQISGMIILLSIYMSVWLFFYWTLYHSLKRVPVINRIRPVVLFFLWLLLSSVGNFIRKTPFFQISQEKKGVNITFMNGIFSAEAVEIQLINIIFYIVITIVVFLTSVWLLERKVEV